ncbi:hypothetical protein D3C78_1501660 [compost metagenome]
MPGELLRGGPRQPQRAQPGRAGGRLDALEAEAVLEGRIPVGGEDGHLVPEGLVAERELDGDALDPAEEVEAAHGEGDAHGGVLSVGA